MQSAALGLVCWAPPARQQTYSQLVVFSHLPLLHRYAFEAQKTKENEAAQDKAEAVLHGRRHEPAPEYLAAIKRREDHEGVDHQMVSRCYLEFQLSASGPAHADQLIADACSI